MELFPGKTARWPGGSEMVFNFKSQSEIALDIIGKWGDGNGSWVVNPRWFEGGEVEEHVQLFDDFSKAWACALGWACWLESPAASEENWEDEDGDVLGHLEAVY
jgi:hypothetical protein